RSLWRAQANCVYWHGLFGGSYLPHLRHSVWSALLTAERELTASEATTPAPRRVFDLDADGHDEVVVATPEVVMVVAPAEGSVVEVSHLTTGVNLIDTLARRPEAYHELDEPPSDYDSARRAWFVDQFMVETSAAPRADAVEEVGRFRSEEHTS